MLQENISPGLAKLTPSQIESRSQLSCISKDRIEFSIERHGDYIPVTYYFRLSIKDRKITQTSAESHYIDVAEFTEHFGFTEQKVHNLIRAGKLKTVKASELQDQWYELMILSGREFVRHSKELEDWDSNPENTYLIPIKEVERFSKLDKSYEKNKKPR